MQLNILWDNFFTKSTSSSIVKFLKSIVLFEDLNTQEISRLERTLHMREYTNNEIVFNEGELGAALYILQEGEVEIYINYKQDSSILLTKLTSGMFFGEIALFEESARSATVVASKDSKIIALSKPDFILFSQKEPTIGLKIVMKLGQILSQRLKLSNKQIENLKSNNV